MPGSLRLLEKFGDDLAVIFVESQGASAAQAELFAYEKGWMGRGAYWTLERPANTGLGYLPSFLLLDTEGRVLLKGSTSSMKSAIEKAVEQQIDAARELPEEFHRSLAKAWKAMAERDYAKAAEELAEQDDPELADQANTLRERLTARFESDLALVRRRIDQGHFVDARQRLATLAGAVEGLEDWSAQVAELTATLAADALAGELEAAERFEKLYAKVCQDGVEDQQKALEKFAAKHAGTKAAERAQALLDLLP